MKINKISVSYRLSAHIIRLINEISEHLDLSKTEMLEELIIKEAQRLKIIENCGKGFHFNKE